MLFDRFGVSRGGAEGKSLLIIGARRRRLDRDPARRTLTKLTVIATASRPETQSWCKDWRAPRHRSSKPMTEQLKERGHRFVTTSSASRNPTSIST